MQIKRNIYRQVQATRGLPITTANKQNIVQKVAYNVLKLFKKK